MKKLFIALFLFAAFCAFAVGPSYFGNFNGNAAGITNEPMPLANEYVDYQLGTVNGARNGAPFNTLSNALLVAQPYDVIQLGEGTDAVSLAVMPVGVTINGRGMNKTFLVFVTNCVNVLNPNANYTGIATAVLPTNDCRISNLSIVDTNFNAIVSTSNGRTPILLFGVTNLTIDHCLLHGCTDIFITSNTNVPGNTNILVDRCVLEFGWDSLASGGNSSTTNDSIWYRGCTFIGRTNFLNQTNKRQTLNNGWNGSVTWESCNFDFNQGSGFNDTVSTGPTFQIINCTYKDTNPLRPYAFTFGNGTNETVNIAGGFKASLVTNLPAATGLNETWYGLSYFTQTNFISGQWYTNTTGGNLLIRAGATLTVASVNGGRSEMDILAGNTTASASITSSAVLLTTNSMFSGNYFMDLSCVVSNNQVYSFTNQSTGAGNSSALVGSSGQFLTIP